MVTGGVQEFSSLPRANASHNGITYEGLRDRSHAVPFCWYSVCSTPCWDWRFQKAVALNETITEYVNAIEYSATCTKTGYFETGQYNLN
jgi:hypothetical protein